MLQSNKSLSSKNNFMAFIFLFTTPFFRFFILAIAIISLFATIFLYALFRAFCFAFFGFFVK